MCVLQAIVVGVGGSPFTLLPIFLLTSVVLSRARRAIFSLEWVWFRAGVCIRDEGQPNGLEVCA